MGSVNKNAVGEVSGQVLKVKNECQVRLTKWSGHTCFEYFSE